MSNILWKKTFNLCFSKFKCLPTITFSSSPPINQEQEEGEPSDLIKNFNSLYDSTSDNFTADDFFSSSEDDQATVSVPDVTSAFASHRFFFSSPGSSNSLFETPETCPQPEQGRIAGGGVAVDKYSPNPYADFRKSMQEMIEARELTGVEADWEFLHELFMCYLTLNPKHTHKFIFGAFADVIVSLVSSPTDNGRRKTHHRRVNQPYSTDGIQDT